MKISDVIPALADYFSHGQAQFPHCLRRAYLFGSYARGEARVGCDVDVALVAGEPWDFDNKSVMRTWLEGFEAGLEVNPFFTTEEKLANTQDKFDANYWIAREGVLLWER